MIHHRHHYAFDIDANPALVGVFKLMIIELGLSYTVTLPYDAGTLLVVGYTTRITCYPANSFARLFRVFALCVGPQM